MASSPAAKKGYHEKLLKKMNKDFWNTSLTTPNSTFGASSKNMNNRKVSDDGFLEIRRSNDWVGHDQHNNNHSRVRIVSSYGRSISNPGPGYYDPNYAKQSKTETIAPDITLSSKYKDNYFDELKQKNKDIKRLNKLNTEYNRNDNDKKKPKQLKIIKGQYADVNIDDMRKSLLPGPGSYDGNYKMVERFERPASAVMAPRTRAAKSRPVVIEAIVTAVDVPSYQPPADQYNIRDVGKKNIAYSIGERRDLLGLPEQTPIGPGCYNTEQVNCIGGLNPVSSTASLKNKPVQSFAELRACMANTSTHGRKGIKW